MSEVERLPELKRELRRRILARRDALTAEERFAWSEQIQKQFFSLSEYEAAERIACFASFGGEVSTGMILRRAIQAGKEVYLPAVHPEGKWLDFYRVQEIYRDLHPGAFGIYEPKAQGEPAEVAGFDLIVTPGVAFDTAGYRVGYGGGFYDRVFAEAGNGPLRVALAFDFQLLPQVPRGPADRPVHLLITEKRRLRFS